MTNKRAGKAEIISIGDELLIGQVVNTNASWMAEILSASGIDLHKITTIGDDKFELHQAIDEALKQAQFVLLTGGLGPTADDLLSLLCVNISIPNWHFMSLPTKALKPCLNGVDFCSLIVTSSKPCSQNPARQYPTAMAQLPACGSKRREASLFLCLAFL